MPKMVGYGTVLGISTDTTGVAPVYTPVASIRSISGPTVETGEVDATTLDSTGAYREYLLALIDPGNLTMELAWDPNQASHQMLTSALADRKLHSFKITLPTTTLFLTFQGRVNSKSVDVPLDDLLSSSVGVRISGTITWPTTTT